MRPSQRGLAEPEGPNHRLKEGVGLMDWHDRTHRRNRDHRVIPTALGLESRQLLSFFAPFSGASTSFFGYSSSNQQLAARAAIVRHEYDTYVSTLKALELGSQATPEEFRALRDDAREISATAAATTLSLAREEQGCRGLPPARPITALRLDWSCGLGRGFSPTDDESPGSGHPATAH
jgi:hypothetical protein